MMEKEEARKLECGHQQKAEDVPRVLQGQYSSTKKIALGKKHTVQAGHN